MGDQVTRPAWVREALRYAEIGLHVLPCHTMVNGHCTCGKDCGRDAGKHPRTDHGLEDATVDPDTIRAWGRQYKHANIGMACAKSDLVVIDVDNWDEFLPLVRERGPLPDTVASISGSGRGGHYFYNASGKAYVGKFPGGEVRWKAYVILPPSAHASGGVYRWDQSPFDRSVSDLNGAWEERITRSTPIASVEDDEIPTHVLRFSKQKQWALEHNRIPEEIDSTQRVFLLGMARQMDSQGWPEADVVDRLWRIMENSSTRLDDPWTPKWAQEIYDKRGDAPPVENRSEQKASVRRDVFDLRRLYEMADEEIVYIVDGLLSPGEKFAIVGPQKAYKTWIALNLAHAVATGTRFLGRDAWQVDGQHPVLFIEEEGQRQKFARRVRRFFNGETAPFYAAFKAGLSLLEKAHVDWIIEEARARLVEVVFIDPWQRVTPGVNEDKSTETGPAWDAVHHIAQQTGAAVVVLHHAKKNGDLSFEAIRGSSRFGGEIDCAIVVRKQKDTNILQAFLDGRDLEKVGDEDDFFQIEYDREDPAQMKVVEFGITIKGASPERSRTARAAVEQFMRSNAGRHTTPTVRSVVTRVLGRKIKTDTINEYLRSLCDQGLVRGYDAGPGKAKEWEWIAEDSD